MLSNIKLIRLGFKNYLFSTLKIIVFQNLKCEGLNSKQYLYIIMFILFYWNDLKFICDHCVNRTLNNLFRLFICCRLLKNSSPIRDLIQAFHLLLASSFSLASKRPSFHRITAFFFPNLIKFLYTMVK